MQNFFQTGAKGKFLTPKEALTRVRTTDNPNQGKGLRKNPIRFGTGNGHIGSKMHKAPGAK